MVKNQKLILLEMNEVNFDFVRRYADQGFLPGFKKLLENADLISTISEKEGHEFEPWIQWMSIHTGKSLAEHRVFRLGDVIDYNDRQIWEYLEQKYSLKTGAVSPMNADNRCAAPAFFIPDPWTGTRPSGSLFLRLLSRAVADGVNKNATGGMKLISYFLIAIALMRYSLPRRKGETVIQVLKALRSSYQRAILLDHLLTDIFCTLWMQSRPDFSSLFLNGCAHLQHHYLFNSPHYDGPHQNPNWYMPAGRDPVLKGFRAYDKILTQIMELPERPRVIIATGLHQTPVDQPVYYWRLKNHSDFLHKINAPHQEVRARMSRDFLVCCANEKDAAQTQQVLKRCIDQKGEAIFGDIDNRGTSIFASLIYPHDIGEGFLLKAGNKTIRDFETMVGFVAIKNAEHNGAGYILDSENRIPSDRPLPVTDIFGLIEDHFSQTKTASDHLSEAA